LLFESAIKLPNSFENTYDCTLTDLVTSSILIPAASCVKAVVGSVNVGHSRMFLAGIQARLGLDPRLKHSGVTNSSHVIIVVY
jgi:hypothetical protein